ncbi:LrgB family protein [Calidifontibacillus erzurumensis]|uniref:LrgB family protein n=1 Tax=Calidifontibacillus erzurumensis TaxID=2741433 RepID=A0A8J8KB70_9BACI|nr:LrgB family protein [Calidifontibacillus erzurumensis]NSL51337.1 LrgB family protein [Calidifontibacillus erzurumensis]
MSLFIAFLAIAGTIITYNAMKKVYIKFYTPFMVPIVTATVLIVCFLLYFDIPYETYMSGAKWIVHLLGPAVVALAFPLYKQIDTVKKYSVPIMVGVFVGTFIGIVSGIWLSLLFHIELKTLYSLVPKSVTSPVAMDIASMIGGNPTLAAIFVMVAGIFGAVLGPYLLKWFRIDHFIGRGIGFGTAAHGIGTSKALELGQKEGAISSIAMTLSTIFASILSPLLVHLLL